jgi:hypothetical protein
LNVSVPLPPPYPVANVSFSVTDPDGVRPAMLCPVGGGPVKPAQPTIASIAANKITLVGGAAAKANCDHWRADDQ